MLTVAHRAGNTIAGLRAAQAAGVDLVETDVHLRREALEVRHGRGHADVLLPDILAVAAGGPRLLLDLKGRSPAVAARVAETLRVQAPGMAVAVCTKQWAMLDAFPDDGTVLKIWSAANRVQVARLRRRLRRGRVDGVSIRLRLLTTSLVAELREATELVLAWPVDTETALARAGSIGVTGVVSKSLPLLQGLATSR
ncbi:glycerophosphodiester phosphodiesterase [Actinoplanes sp. TFC3]|uniref:glycerophosphodiester phosphodiesterase n=1 Tax=Actinoplanes sp. TFC3 TaxID=1710355 RepID=UPI0008295841|nr:glycerophosphodiester phosphodiesterase [Actinoplanes sp. TFC3]